MPALKPVTIGHPCPALRCGCPLVADAAAAVAEAKAVRARHAEEPWPVHAR